MIIKVLGAFLAIFAFAVLLEIPKKYLWCGGMAGAVGWLTYLISVNAKASVVLATFFSAMAISFMSHMFARIFKVPVTVFLVAGILPTVPGAGMYRTVYYAMAGNKEMASGYLINTLQIAGVIALAIFLVDSIWHMNQQHKFRKMRGEKHVFTR